MSNGKAVSYVCFGMAALSELMIYTYFGTKVTVGHEGLHRVLLEADWNSWTPKQRAVLVILIKQSQRECRISFLDWLPCSEDTLRWVITNSFSLFALLQNLGNKD